MDINQQQFGGYYQGQPMYPQGGYVQPQVGYTPYATTPQGGVYPPMFGGPMYGQNVQPGTNPISQDVINELLKRGAGSQLHLDEMDLIKAKCTHRNPAQNRTTLVDAGHDGMVHCEICGADFHLLDNVSAEDVAKAAQNVCDIIHTMKVMWRDIPTGVAEEYCQVEAVVKQIPQMYNIACHALQKYNENYMGYQNPQMNGFAALGSVIGGMPMGGAAMAYQQPYYPQQYPAAGAQVQQPMFDPRYMNPQAQVMTQGAPGLSNGFGVTTPQPQQPVMTLQPQPQAPQVPQAQPQQAAPAPAPVAPAPQPTQQGEGARVTETLQV